MTQMTLAIDDSFPRTHRTGKVPSTVKIPQDVILVSFYSTSQLHAMVHSECTIPIPPKETVGKPKTTLNFPWVFYTSRFREESQYKYSFQLPVMKSSRLFFWAPSVFPGALETRPGAGTLHVQGPGSSMQDGSQPLSRMEPCGRSPLEIEIDPRHSGRHPCGVQQALVVSHKLTRF